MCGQRYNFKCKLHFVSNLLNRQFLYINIANIGVVQVRMRMIDYLKNIIFFFALIHQKNSSFIRINTTTSRLYTHTQLNFVQRSIFNTGQNIIYEYKIRTIIIISRARELFDLPDQWGTFFLRLTEFEFDWKIV